MEAVSERRRTIDLDQPIRHPITHLSLLPLRVEITFTTTFLMYNTGQSPTCVGSVGLAYGNILSITIKTDGYTVTPPYEKVVDAMMSRHPQVPISIDMYDWNNTRVSLDNGIDPRILATFAAYLDLFYTVIHRWKSVRFDGPLISIIASMTKQRFPSVGPTALESVAIKDTDSVRSLDSLRKFMSLLWSGKAWAFSQFCVDNYIAFNKQIFRDLPYSRLTHLEIHSTVTAALVHEILAEAFGMVRCTISDVTSPGPSQDRLAAHTPNLEYLSMEIDTMDFDKARRTGAIVSILHKLVAPALTELRLGYEDCWNSQVFVDLCKRSRFNLEVLHLVKMAMKPRHLAQILMMNPSITELVVEGQSKGSRDSQTEVMLTDDILQQLMFNPHGGHLCPDLDSLTINISAVQTQNGLFRRMVRDRFRNSNLRQVKIIEAQGLSEKDRNALLELASYRMSVWFDGTRLVDPRWHW